MSGSRAAVVTELQRDGWTFRVVPPSVVPHSYRRWVCGRSLLYHGRVEVLGREVTGFPTNWATPNLSVHMDTLLTVFDSLWPNQSVWERRGDGTLVTHIFGPDRSVDGGQFE